MKRDFTQEEAEDIKTKLGIEHAADLRLLKHEKDWERAKLMLGLATQEKLRLFVESLKNRGEFEGIHEKEYQYTIHTPYAKRYGMNANPYYVSI